MNRPDRSVKQSAYTNVSKTSEEEKLPAASSGLDSFYAMHRAIQNPSREMLTQGAVMQLQNSIGNQNVQRLLRKPHTPSENIGKIPPPTFGSLVIQRDITVGGRDYTTGGIRQFLKQDHKLDSAKIPFLDEAIRDLSQSDESFTDWKSLIVELENTRKRLVHLSGMNDLTTKNLKWGSPAILEAPAMLEKNKPFSAWINQNGPEPSVMNCWEAVLFAAFKQGLINKEYIKKAIQRKQEKGIPDLVTSIIKKPVGQAVKQPEEFVPQIQVYTIPAGFIILFGKWGEHAAISTGARIPIQDGEARRRFGGSDTGHGILELDSKTGGVAPSTLEDTVIRGGSAYSSIISWGPLPEL